MPSFVAFKAKRPQAVLRPRGRLSAWRAVDAARRKLTIMTIPVPQPCLYHIEGYIRMMVISY